MDVTLPPEIDAVLELMGVPWPNVSVEEILADRDAWITVLAGAGTSGVAAASTVGATGAAYRGESATALAGLWDGPAGVGDLLGQASSAVRYVPQVLDNAAWLTTAVKAAVAGAAVVTSVRIARAMLMGGPAAGPMAFQELIQGRVRALLSHRAGTDGVGRVLRPAMATGSTGKFRGVLDDLPRLNTARGPDGPRGMSIAQMVRKNNRDDGRGNRGGGRGGGSSRGGGLFSRGSGNNQSSWRVENDGRIHGDPPTSARGMTEQEAKSVRDKMRKSIKTRKKEEEQKGYEVGHAERIRREERALKDFEESMRRQEYDQPSSGTTSSGGTYNSGGSQASADRYPTDAEWEQHKRNRRW